MGADGIVQPSKDNSIESFAFTILEKDNARKIVPKYGHVE